MKASRSAILAVTIAGAINYVIQRPTADWSGHVEGTVGDNDLYKVHDSVSGPVSDTIRVRIGGFSRKFDGWYRSAIHGGRVDFEKSYGGIGMIEIKPGDALTATFRLSYAESEDGQPPSSFINGAARLHPAQIDAKSVCGVVCPATGGRAVKTFRGSIT
jgi:hypothetical protein